MSDRAELDAIAYEAPMSPALVSTEAEQGVLGGLLLDNGAYDRIGDVLRPDYFHAEQHRRIYSTITRMLVANKPADILTVFEELRAHGVADSLSYLNALAQSVVSAANIRRYAGIVVERWKARQLMSVGMRAVEIAQDATTGIDERIDQMQGEIGKLSEQAAQRESASLDEAMVRAIDRIQQRAEGNIRVFPTGLHDLDRMLGGGIRPGNLAILAARPSMGKTALAVSIALAMTKDRGVGFLSLEMSEEELMDRVVAGLGHADLDDVQRPANAPDTFWTKITDAAEAGAGRGFHIDDQGGLTLHQVCAKARNMKRKYSIDVLIVDYLQLMSGTDTKVSRAYQLEEITRGLKSLAKSLGIGVIALAQVNRRVEGDMPGLADLKDSGAIEQDADIVAFIHRPIQVDPTLGSEWKRFSTLRVAKNRQGRTGDIHLSYIGNETRFAGWSGEIPVKRASARRDL
ncbi:replicative DNA helicase [Rhizobacter fulvus]